MHTATSIPAPALRAFHGDPTIKQKYLSRVQAHAAADRLVKGLGWNDGKGCAIGCTLETYEHARYPIELGLPEWLAHLEDAIFEGLPQTEAMAWPEAFLEAITPGVNVELIRHKLTLRRIDRLITSQTKSLAAKRSAKLHAMIERTITALHQVRRRCHEAEIGGDVCLLPAESAARSAAWSAAESAAWSAAWKTEASDLLELLRECTP